MVTSAEVYVRVAAPPVVPHPYGLFSVSPPIAPTEAAWQAGVTWESWACLDPNTTTSACWNGGAAPPPKEFDVCPDTGQFKPVTVYVGAQRSNGGERVAAEQATGILANAEEYAVEKYVWAQMVAAEAPGAALPAATALGVVEAALRQGYMGAGVIHMGPVAATVLSPYLIRVGSRMETIIGTPVVVGGGYNIDAATAGPSLIYGTGALAVRRGTVNTYRAFDTAVNDELVIAERTYVVGWDCFVTGREATL